MKTHRQIPFPDSLRDEADARELRATWALLNEAAPREVDPGETDRALEAVHRSLSRGGAGGDLSLRPFFRAARKVLVRAAAIAALALGASAAWYAVPVTQGAGPGERLTLGLPDGSTVELNAGSTLSYRKGFRLLPGLSAGTRGVRLEGEAFFTVEPGVRPFVVSAGEASIRVLGTRFNVRAREAGSEASGNVRVEVEEGRVEVWGSGERALLLGAGEAARVLSGSGSLEREEVEPGRIASWRDGGLTMVDETLSGILQELGLRYGVGVVLQDESAGAARLNVYYPALESLESVLSDLATQQNLRYRRTSEGWELF